MALLHPIMAGVFAVVCESHPHIQAVMGSSMKGED